MEIGESRKSYLFSSDTISIDYSTCAISFCVGDDSISYAIFDDVTHEALYLERFSLKDHLEDDVSFPFSGDVSPNVVIRQCGGAVTIIPDHMKGEHEMLVSTYFGDQKEVSKENVEGLNAQLFYQPSQALRWLCDQFPGAEVGHHLTCMIENGLLRNRYQKGVKIYIDVQESCAEMMMFSDSKLVSAMSESYTSKSDLFFQLVARIEEFGFHQLEDTLFISGLISKEDQLYKDLSKYIKELRLHAGFKFQKIHRDLGVIPKHRFFNVINAYQCV